MNKTIELPRFAREVEIRAQSYDEAKRTVDMIWTTGATVRRYSWMDGPYDEELMVTPKAVRLSRLNAGAPFLNSHDGFDLSGVIGSVVQGSARIEKGQGVATVILSKRDDVAGIVQDIRDGIIRNISVGYRVHQVEKTERDDGTIPLWKVVDWEPLELSAVPIPADPGAQLRGDDPRHTRQQLYPCVLTFERSEGASALTRMRMRARELGLAV